MKTRACLLIISLLSMALVGCATVPRLATPSGKPGVLVKDRSAKEIKDRLVAGMISRGYDLRTDSDYQLVFGKRVPRGSLTAILHGSTYDTSPEHRISFVVVDRGADGVQVMASMAIVTNPGSAYERVTPWNHRDDAQAMQTALENLHNPSTPQTAEQPPVEAQMKSP